MRIISVLMIVAVAMALTVSGCDLFKAKPAPEQEQTPPPAEVEETAPPAEVPEETMEEETAQEQSMSDETSLPILYQYDKVHEYEYRINTQVQGVQQSTDLKVRISPDTLEGKAAWRTDTDVQAEGVTATTSTWIDKTTYKCLKIETQTNVMGQTYSNSIACPEVDPTQVTVDEKTGKADIQKVGTESVTVPAGTFTADKYVAGETDSQFWLGKDVPIPVKMQYQAQGVSSTMELVSYK